MIVYYTIDETGFRVLPHVCSDSSLNSIVIFGDSFTFGVGLEDDEVMLYILQNSVRNKYKVYNFSVEGYGPHQMLSFIENRIIDSIIEYEPSVLITK